MQGQHDRVVYVVTTGVPLGAVIVTVITNTNNNGQIGIGILHVRAKNAIVIIAVGNNSSTANR
jgi:hypothetical protein